jgi:serine/threonine protein kinase
MDGTTVGTPFYISPEQARGTRDLDQRADLYSLGCTVFHMLTGSVPFFHEEFTEVMLKQTQAPRPDPRSILEEISEGSAKLVMRMMAINPAERPQTFDELLAEIDALLPTLPKPTADVRPVAAVSASDVADRRADFWVPPAPSKASIPPAPAAGKAPSVPKIQPAPAAGKAPSVPRIQPAARNAAEVETKPYKPSPKTTAFARTPASQGQTAQSASAVQRVKAWFGRLFGK